MFPLSSQLNCASHIEATSTLVIVACPKNGVIEVLQAATMGTLYQTQDKNQKPFQEDWTFISLENDSQLYLFFTYENSFTVFSVEILVNAKTNETFVVERILDQLILANQFNFGKVQLTGGNNLLLTNTENFDQFVGYALCSFKQILEGVTCVETNNSELFLIDPFTNLYATC